MEASFKVGNRVVAGAFAKGIYEAVVRAVFEHSEGSESARLAAALDTLSGIMSEDIVDAGVVIDASVCDVSVAEEPTGVAIAFVEGMLIKLNGEDATEAPRVPVIFAKGASVGDAPDEVG